MSAVKVPVCPKCESRVMLLCRTETAKSDVPSNHFLKCHDCKAETPKRAILRDALAEVAWVPMDAPQ